MLKFKQHIVTFLFVFSFLSSWSQIIITNGNTTTCSDTFYDSGGPGSDYSYNEYFEYTIYPSTAGNMIQLDFTLFDLETCCDDFYIYDGTSTSDPLIGTFTSNPGTITASNVDGALTIVFDSDGSVQEAGWEANISCVPIYTLTNGGSVTTCSGLFTDPEGFSNYNDNSGTWSYTICSGTSEALEIDFTEFLTAENKDKLEIFDGPNNSSTSLGVFANSDAIGTIVSSGTCLTFEWTTDNGGTSTGWLASISCIPAPPANDDCSNAISLPCGTTNMAGTTVSSTSATHGMGCSMSNYGVWYTFTGDGNLNTISVDPEAGFNAEISIATGSCGSFTNVDCEDLNGSGSVESTTISTTNGTTYYVYVAYYLSTGTASNTGAFTISRTCITAPSNNLCSAATNLPCGTSNLAGTTVGTTNIAHGTGCSLSNYGVWYTFVGDGQITTITVDANFDSEIAIATGSCGSLTNVSCEDNGNPETYTFIATNGVTYYVYVAHWSSSSTTTGTFDISRSCTPAPPVPSNDLCTDAITLPCGTTNLAGTTDGATNVAHGTGCTMSNYGVWYKFTGDGQTNLITVTPEAGYEIELSLNSGSCGSLTNIGCLDQNGAGTAESRYISTVNGTIYYLYIAYDQTSGGSFDTGDFTVSRECIPPPTNDLCSGATSLPCGTSNLAGSTAGSTAVSDPASCASDYGVWYTFTGDGQETTITCDAASGFDNEMVIFSGSCGSLTNITCEDSGLSGGIEDYTFVTTIGTTYYIYIAENSTGAGVNDVGDFTISRTCTPVYTVTYFANGGTGYMPPQSSSSATSLDANTFSQSSCYFLNWNTALNGSGTTYTDEETYNFTSDVSLYAQWSCGSGCLHSIVLYDDYSDGWNLSPTVDVLVNGVTVLSGLTLATGYGPESYTFAADDGDVIEVEFTTGGGSYDDECYFDVVDGYGNNLADDYYPDVYGLTWTGAGNCNPPSPLAGQDCAFPVVVCSDPFTVGNPGYSGTGDYGDFTGTGNCTGGEKNSVWLQIDISGTGDLNFTIMPNDGSNNSNGAETDYDFLLWRIAGTGATTDCSNITASSGDGLLACNYDSDGVTGVAPGGNAPSPIDSWFDGAFEPTVSVTAGDVLLLCIQNFSGSTQGFELDLSSSDPGVVNYSSPSTIYWTAGSSNTDWTDIGNWGNCTVSPACGVNAIVTSSGTTSPLIPTGDTRSVNDLTINPAATLTLEDNATLHVCGDFTNNGNIVFGTNSYIIFDGGSTVQNIYGFCTGVNDFGHFIIDKSGGEVILNCNIGIAGDFSNLSNTSILNTNGYEVYLEGHFDNFNGNTTYTNSGTTGALYFIGAANQNYDEGASQLDLNHIVMNNSGSGVTLLTNMYSKTVSGSLTLSDGVIITDNFEVYVQNDASSCVSGHSVASYVQGNLRRNIQSLGSYDFPVGDAVKEYQNATIEFVTPTSINNLLARFDPYPGAIPTQGGSECSTTYNLPCEDNGYWTITADANGNTGSYNVTLYPTNATNTSGASGWTVTKKPTISTGTWDLIGLCVGTSTASVVMRDDVTGFSVFAAAQATIPLPVTLVAFEGKIEDKVNHLYWETASELNSDYFDVLRSEDGINFFSIGSVSAAGNSNTMKYYDFVDFDPLIESYYRLSIVDENGSSEYSNIILLKREGDFSDINVSPNPNAGYFDLNVNSMRSQSITVQLFDYTGRLIISTTESLSEGLNKTHIDLSEHANGIYTLIVLDDNNSRIETVKVIKQK